MRDVKTGRFVRSDDAGKYILGFERTPLLEKTYNIWRCMVNRGKHKNFIKGSHSEEVYKDVSICEEWCNFQNFAEWCETQKFLNAKDVKGKSYQLDKDILVKGSKVYSPETCCFVPPEINSLFIKQQNTRGEFPIGVWFDRRSGKYQACVSKNGETVCLGLFETPKKAFEHYKKVKESHIKEVAEIWKDRIDGKVYKALLTWEIEEND